MALKQDDIKKSLTEHSEWLSRELSTIRTGRATPTLLDGVMVESYGTLTKISHVAALSVEDAKTIRINPWDKSSFKAIESAIQAANLGVSVVPDATGLRVSFPDLSSERRQIMKKLVREKLEAARVSLRKDREHFLRLIEDKKKSKEIGEDEAKRDKDSLQKLVDEKSALLESLASKKEEELS
jgi:ribosome recycling factor